MEVPEPDHYRDLDQNGTIVCRRISWRGGKLFSITSQLYFILLNTYYLFFYTIYFYQVINFPEARAGHEEELVKMVSLMMYLGTVKYPNSTLSGTLADCKLFSKEVQLRVKCVLQVFVALIRIPLEVS